MLFLKWEDNIWEKWMENKILGFEIMKVKIKIIVGSLIDKFV